MDELGPMMLRMNSPHLGGAPIPPADLMLRVTPPFDAEDIESARSSFDVEGLNTLRLFERAISAIPAYHAGGDVWLGDERVAAGRSIADFERLLDFGCGCGRLLRHLGGLSDNLEIHGTDIDVEMIEWLRSNVPFGRYEVASLEPPLPYPDHYFDLVICYSVFTHLDERLQNLWLDELRRITRPDALLLLTVHGASVWNRTREDVERIGGSVAQWEAELETRGILFIADDAFVGSTHPESYHSTIHAPWYVHEHWTKFFDVEGYLPDGAWSQDLVILRRRLDGAPPASPPIRRRPGSAEPVLGAGTGRSNPQRRFMRVLKLAVGRVIDRLARSSTVHPTLRRDRDRDAVDLEPISREVSMLRAGLYEQGRRISVVTAQLRDEISAARSNSSGDDQREPDP